MGVALLAAADSDVDFMIKGLFSYQLFGQEVWITSTHVCMLLVSVVLLVLALFARRRMKKAEEIPGVFQNILELLVESLDKLVSSNMGRLAPKFRNYIGTIFAFILVSNLSGIFGLRSPTADYGVTLLLGVMSFLMIQYNGIKYQKLGHFKGLLEPFPVFLPVNIISEVAVPISLSLRLFANVLSGTIIMALWYGLVPVLFKLGIPAFMHVYFDIFSGCIQTYVFCMLTMVFITDKAGE